MTNLPFNHQIIAIKNNTTSQPGAIFAKLAALAFALKDTLSFIRKLTPLKLYNAAAVLASYYLTRLWQKPVVWGMPFTISFEPTTACNLRCPGMSQRSKGRLPVLLVI